MTETVNSKFDTLKIAAALLIVLGGLVGFYMFSGESLLFRVMGLIACSVVAILICMQTERGRTLVGFFQEAQTEVRKVVWPTRQETIQTTGIVIVMVLIFAGLLWVLDLVLGWAIRFVIGGA